MNKGRKEGREAGREEGKNLNTLPKDYENL
jgi:predicted transposase YdaD